MFKKILIANRGEIACRIAATARRLGIQTVAVYSDADADARHVQACDEAVHLGGAAPRDSYLRWERILEAARATGAEAVHPGYGFLSENEAFARACAEAGVVFIGPPPAAIEAMGLKAESKRLMAAAGVPLVPGYHGADQDPALLAREAAAIGFPVLIKASAGGGGKGMRIVRAADEFAAALASCQREARNSFGSDAVLIERYVQRPRHVEIQVFFDTHGQGVHLFERDCSVQRRHQKVLEEAPAPGLSDDFRAAMGQAALAAARAVGYVGAGTVEFIVEPLDEGASATAGPPPGGAAPTGTHRFFFMEMNTRLQVEHPVTEAITGLDLVEWQLRVAAGEPLPLRQDEIPRRGHAIEARICAENPEAQFLPATGRLAVARWPEHVAFQRHDELPRIDRGFDEGDEITPHYDSMIAKLIVWGADRAQALARLDAALARTQLVGLHTNTAFLRRVVGSRSFAEADLDTALIEREHTALFEAAPLPDAAVAAAVVAHTLAEEGRRDAARPSADRADPWSRRDGWRLHGAARRRFDIRHAGQVVAAELTRHHQGAVQLRVGETVQPFAAQAASGAAGGAHHELHWGAQRWRIDAHAHEGQLHLFSAQGSAVVTCIDPLAAAADGAGAGGRITAPMPGKVVAVLVQAGDRVTAGQPLAVMEAMKMEHTLTAPAAGVVQALRYAVGEQVPEGAPLMDLDTGVAEAARAA